ncbi:Growth_factor receptor cysteine-rich domain superfamily [Hexamita inflata]|uniref:Growth factor receptor cysteine-rich domain superfamily n=1 Tax=Hexamita inflata TaxID=28002 RepID=A0AA86TC03_9EUKA|nr:Growth factor receptor cysteine-rich domain superfamily [Hexamita inflata]CAI9953386.1 Growth factor receptor cysteine-rich domain superfamily [Hexamita inflata]
MLQLVRLLACTTDAECSTHGQFTCDLNFKACICPNYSVLNNCKSCLNEFLDLNSHCTNCKSSDRDPTTLCTTCKQSFVMNNNECRSEKTLKSFAIVKIVVPHILLIGMWAATIFVYRRNRNFYVKLNQ